MLVLEKTKSVAFTPMPLPPPGLCVPHPEAGVPQGCAPGSLSEQCEPPPPALDAPLSPDYLIDPQILLCDYLEKEVKVCVG